MAPLPTRVALSWASAFALAGAPSPTVVRVGSSSAANAPTIAAGLALVPVNSTSRWSIELEPGTYPERISTADKGPLSIVGLGLAEAVVVAYGCSNANGTGELGCRPCPTAAGFHGRATLTVGSEDFVATNITFANDACGYNAAHAAQSEAVSLEADRAAFANCRFLGGQDTLYTGKGPLRSHFSGSFINGSCDRLFASYSLHFPSFPFISPLFWLIFVEIGR